jgi:Tfp pilus assembly protein PilF
MAGWLMWLGSGGVAFSLRRRWTMGWIGWVWWSTAMLPFWGVIPMNANASEHWCYLASVGLIAAAVDGLTRIIRHRQVFAVGACGVIIAAAVGSGFRNRHFENEIVFFKHMLKRQPQNARMHYNLGTALALAGQYETAATSFQAVIRLDPEYAQAYANLGLILYKQGQVESAMTLYRTANSLRQDLVENHVNLGNALAGLGQAQAAVQAFQKALTVNPRHAGAMNGIGVEFAKQGRWKPAQQWFQRSLMADSQFEPARANLQRLQSMRAAQQR